MNVSPPGTLSAQIEDALTNTAYCKLSTDDRDSLHSALTEKAILVLADTCKEAASAVENRPSIETKESLAYVKRGLDCPADAGPVAARYTLTIEVLREAADRLAAVEHVVTPISLVPALLHTGVGGDAVYVSQDGQHGSAPAHLLADLIGVDMYALVVDCWVASREEAPSLRANWLKDAGRRGG